jgi:hypothetical protein
VPTEQLNRMITAHQAPMLMVIYSAGYTAVFVIFALLYHYALSKRRELMLNEYETLRTKHAMIFHIGFALLGVLVIISALVLPERYAGMTGSLFCLNAVVGFAGGSILGKRERHALARMEAASKPASAEHLSTH